MSQGGAFRVTFAAALVAVVLVGVNKTAADFTFGPAVNLGPEINSSMHDAGPLIAIDDLSFLFWRITNWTGEYETWLATRETPDEPWAAPVYLGLDEPDTFASVIDIVPGVTTADGLELYYSSSDDLPGGHGSIDIYVMTRETVEEEWGDLVNLGPVVNSSAQEMIPAISPDGLELYFSGYNNSNARPGGQGGADLWMTMRDTRADPWGEPVNLGPIVNSPNNDARISISADGLILLFDSGRPGGFGSADLYMMTRKALGESWSDPVNLGPQVNSAQFEEDGYLSPDGSILYWDSARPGGYGGHDIWQAPVIPVVDFNGDGQVDGLELTRMANCWGTNDPSCDIGPRAWGDGTVDAEDLKVLAAHLDSELIDYTLMAHWALDETAGDVAHDGGAQSDGRVLGEPAWQPEGGMLCGAMACDGVDDYIETPRVVGLASGAFSVLAWVKGGAPCQTIISANNGPNWLTASMSNRQGIGGNLRTEFGGEPLTSSACITDGQWHRIALAWDGASRSLYVDDVLVAQDAPGGVGQIRDRLYIGCAGDRSDGSFWSGLIDEVRIYNRAVRP